MAKIGVAHSQVEFYVVHSLDKGLLQLDIKIIKDQIL